MKSKDAPISERLKALIEKWVKSTGKKSFNETEVAKAMGLKAPTLHRYISGEIPKPGPDKLFKIATYFKVPMDYFYSPNWRDILVHSDLIGSTTVNWSHLRWCFDAVGEAFDDNNDIDPMPFKEAFSYAVDFYQDTINQNNPDKLQAVRELRLIQKHSNK